MSYSSKKLSTSSRRSVAFSSSLMGVDFLAEPVTLNLKKGESAFLAPRGDAPAPVVEPVASQEWRLNFYGSRKAAATDPIAVPQMPTK